MSMFTSISIPVSISAFASVSISTTQFFHPSRLFGDLRQTRTADAPEALRGDDAQVSCLWLFDCGVGCPGVPGFKRREMRRFSNPKTSFGRYFEC